ncbi:MAG: hypothetical protein JO025_16085 [Verrucomicrobia bacterium]|nr:hypothetical protein [Verrucomicrobiota bacterium]
MVFPDSTHHNLYNAIQKHGFNKENRLQSLLCRAFRQLDRHILFSTYATCRRSSCQGQTVAGNGAFVWHKAGFENGEETILTAALLRKDSGMQLPVVQAFAPA